MASDINTDVKNLSDPTLQKLLLSKTFNKIEKLMLIRQNS